jgi:putative protein kinase ArgK-like GTPase of G3E family
LEKEAMRSVAEYTAAVKLLRHKSANWQPKVMAVSSRNSAGIEKFWEMAQKFRGTMEVRRGRAV